MSDQVPMVATDNRRWWHYTTGTKFMGIVKEGRIRLADARVAIRERPAVWFSCRDGWEPTAGVGTMDENGKTRDATIAEMVADFGPLVRLEVPESVARHTWEDHRRIGGVDWRAAAALVESALAARADPDEWRLSYQDVRLSEVTCVEASEDGRTWAPVVTLGAEGWAGARLDAAFVDKVREARKRERTGATEGS